MDASKLRENFSRLTRLRFVRFCITGGLNTLVDFGVFWCLTALLAVNPYLAQVLSYSAGILNSYCINRTWTFGSQNRFFSGEMVRFLAVNLIVLAASVGTIALFTGQLGLPVLLAKLFTTGITIVLGFALNRLLVFR